MSLAEFCVRRPAFTTMLIMSLVVTGLFSFRDLSVDLLPKADPATVSVTVRLPGASPDEMSTSVAEPLEQALSSIAGDRPDRVAARRRHRPDHGPVRARARHQRGGAGRAREGRRGDRPAAAAGRAAGHRQGRSRTRTPIFSFALGGPLRLRALTEIADKQIRRALETVDGVGEVTISGGRAREVHVEPRHREADAHGLTVDQVRDAIVAENVEVPGGRIDQGDAEVMLRTPGRLERVERVQPDRRREPREARRSASPDVADGARTREEEARTAAFLDGQRAVVMDVRRQSGQNTIQVIEDVKAGARRAPPRAAAGSEDGLYARRLAVHLRVDRLARGAPDPRQPARQPGHHAVHPEHPA